MIYLAIYCLIFASLLIFTIKWPSVAIAAVFCMFSLEQWAQSVHPFFLEHRTITNYLVGGLVVFALFVKVLRRDKIFGNYPSVGILIIVLFLYAFTSTLWVAVPDVSYSLWAHQLPYMIVIVLLSPLLFSTSDDLSVALTVLILLGTVLSVMLLFTSNWTYRGVELIGARSRTAMGNPLAVAELGGMMMLAAGFLCHKAKRYTWGLIKWCAIVFGMAIAVKAGARGQFLGMLVAFLSFYLIAKRKDSYFRYLTLGLGAVFFAVVSWLVFDSISTKDSAPRWDPSVMTHDIAGRWTSLGSLLQEWSSSSVSIVLGLGNSASYDPKIIGIYPHIVVFEILGEEGLIGFLLLGIILLLSLRNLVSATVSVKNNHSERSVFMAIGSIAFFFFMLSFKQGSMIGSLPLFSFLIYLGKYRNIVSEKAETAEVLS